MRRTAARFDVVSTSDTQFASARATSSSSRMIGASNPTSRSRSCTRRYHRTVPSRPTLNRPQTVSG